MSAPPDLDANGQPVDSGKPPDLDEQGRPMTPRRMNIGETAANLLPTVGGTIGSLTGGTLGAVAGGMAGAGYRSIARNADQILPAMRDVASNVISQPGATWEGFKQGAQEGALDAAKQGAIQGGANVVGNAVGGAARRLAPALMQSALKPGIKTTLSAIKSGNVPPVVQTLLDEGVNVTPGGIEKLNGIIGASNQTIQDALGGLPAGTAISPLRVVSRLSETARRFGNQVNPQGDLEAISQVGENFLGAHGAQDLAPMAAQGLKTGTYAALKSKAYGEVKGATVEAEKALARGLKEELASEAAKSGLDISAVNAREGAAITARDAIAKRVAMVGNRDPAGLAWLAHSPVTFLMAVSERSPLAKSLLARGLYSAAARASGMPTEALRWAVGTVAAQESGQ